MNETRKQAHAQAQARHRANHPEYDQRYREKLPVNYRQMQRWKFKLRLIHEAGGCCTQCGIDDPRLLDFDHIDPSTKHYDINYALNNLNQASVLAEVGKCRLLCANCHRLTHTKVPWPLP